MADEIEGVLMKIGMILVLRRKRQGRHHWVHPINTRREDLGEYHHLVQELHGHSEHFQLYFQISPAQFDQLLH